LLSFHQPIEGLGIVLDLDYLVAPSRDAGDHAQFQEVGGSPGVVVLELRVFRFGFATASDPGLDCSCGGSGEGHLTVLERDSFKIMEKISVQATCGGAKSLIEERVSTDSLT
jgi:hypothetical protein